MAFINNKNSATRVLVVDDQPITRELLSRAVSARGLTVDSASNGQEALTLWLSEQHSLVITDCHMPIKDGYALSRDIRQLELTEQIKRTTIIAWSANTANEDQDKCLKAGMDSFLKKPINFDQLNQVLSPFSQQTQKTPRQDVHVHTKDLIVANPSPIDYNILNQIVPDSTKQIKVIKDLLNYLNKDYLLLQEYANTQQLSELKNAAHRLKGACKMVGANVIASIFAVIESEVLEISSNKTSLLLNDLKDAMNQLDQYIQHNEVAMILN